MTAESQPACTVLPIPERGHVGLTTYDAKDPDTSFPPIEALRPPAGAPNVLIVMIDDCRLRLVERVRRAVQHAEHRAARRERSRSSTGSTPPRCARRRAPRC